MTAAYGFPQIPSQKDGFPWPPLELFSVFVLKPLILHFADEYV